jgi:1,5-anhydro-D-fructose reductase (1,5-anhydro-D-mannitol-forming)
MPDRTLGWGLIGASTIAREYMIPAIQAQPDSRVAAVMSRSAARARQYAAENGIEKSYDTVDELLADPGVDVVYISTTNERHKAETLLAAAAGKHVLCEKPLALTLADAREMAAACKTAGVVMGTNHHLRNAVTHRTLRRLVAGGSIGTALAARVFHAIYLPPHLQTWRIKNPEAGAGVILDITVHDADTLRFILNDEVEAVTAMATQQGMAESGLEDAVMGVMQFRHGVQAQVHDAFTIRHAGTGLQVLGTEGSLVADDVMTQRPMGRISLHRAGNVESISLDPPEDLYSRAVRNFNEAVHGRGEPSATADDGIRSLAVGLAVLESTRTGRHVRVDYGNPISPAS